MRVLKHLRFAARSWRATLLAIVVCMSGLVTAQSTVTRTEVSTDLLLALLGSGKAIEIGLPDDVRAVHVVATQGNAVVIDRTTEVGERPDDQATSMVVSVGAIGATLRCPLLVFIHVSLERAGRASGGGMTATCIEVDAPVALWPVPQDGLHEASFDAGTWYAVDGFWPAEIGPGAPQPTPDDTIVFHVYLATDDATPPIEELGVTGR